MNDSPPALLRGKEWRCPRHLLRSSRLPHLRVACVRAALSPLWTISGPAGTQGAPRSCERLDAPAYDSARGGAALEDTGGRPRRQADWVLLCGGAVQYRRGKMCCLGLLLYCRELLGTVLDSVAEQSSLGDESVEKAHFVDFAPLSKAEP